MELMILSLTLAAVILLASLDVPERRQPIRVLGRDSERRLRSREGRFWQD